MWLNILVTLPYEHFTKLGSADCTVAAGSGLIVVIEWNRFFWNIVLLQYTSKYSTSGAILT